MAYRPAMARASWPFPFFGQGDAEYYEWFERWVWFADPVPAAQRKRVLADAPRLCTLDAQWPHPALLWASTGDQWIQLHLVDAYGTAAAKRRMAEAMASDDDDDLDDRIASGGETAKLNADIERWLLALHARRPILFAARRQDSEAGGTRLGAWHAWSVAAYPERVQGALAALGRIGKKDLRSTPIALVLDYVGAAKVTKPERPQPSKALLAIERAILAGKPKSPGKLGGTLECVVALGLLYERVLMWGLRFDDAAARLACTLARGAFSDGSFADHERLCAATEDYMLDDAASSLYYVALAGAYRHDRALFATLRRRLRTRSSGARGAHPQLIYGKLGALGTPLDKLAVELEDLDADGLEGAAQARFELGDPAGGLALCERAAAKGKPSWRLVSNAIAMAVHAHPKRFPRAVLARWMKRAPKRGTHAGYWENVACAQVRLGRHADAIASLRRAVELGFDKETIANDAVLAPLRTRPDYREIME
jgi:hypothetical protein